MSLVSQVAPTGAGDSTMETRLCPGCKKTAVSDTGGLVVAFGQSFFHVECFKCAKCGDQVTADTSLLLLSDGSPVCSNCSYSCNVCNQPILDEAIMTGDDAYHAHCFKCKVCSNRIDDLVFAKTSQGIYCMSCHNERMIKIRKHTQRKAEKERLEQERAERNLQGNTTGAGSAEPHTISRSKSKSSTRKPSSRDGQPSNGMPPLTHTSSSNSIRSPAPARRSSGPYVSDAFADNTVIPMKSPRALPPPPVDVHTTSDYFNNGPTGFQMTTSPPPSQQSALTPDQDRPRERQQTLPVPTPDGSGSSTDRRKSLDDGVRPLNVLFKQAGISAIPTTALNVPKSTSRSDRRRSINPGLSFDISTLPKASASTPSPPLSPRRSETPPIVVHDHDSPHVFSPLREEFPTPPSSRSTSGYYSPSTSPIPPEKDVKPPVAVDPPPPMGRSRSASTTAFVADEESIGVRPAMRSGVSVDRIPRAASTLPLEQPLDRFPTRTHSLANMLMQPNERLSPSTSPGVSPPLASGGVIRPQRSFDDRASHSMNAHRRISGSSSLNTPRARSKSSSRPNSPGHRVDVPHSIESGTDTDTEQHENDAGPSRPRPPMLKTTSNGLVDHNTSALSQMDSADGSSDLSESSPVERTVKSTFIAPALPPIRFSLSGADFSDLLNSVGGVPSLKSLDRLARLPEKDEAMGTPPPSAASALSFSSTGSTGNAPLTPSSQHTVLPTGITPSGRDRAATTLSTARPKPKLNGRPSTASGDGGGGLDSPLDPRARTSSDVSPINGTARVTLTEPGGSVTRALNGAQDGSSELALTRVQEALKDAKERGATQLKLEIGFVEAIAEAMLSRKAEYVALKAKLDGMKRASKQYIEGMSVAQTEYDQELKARRDAEAEVTRLRVLLSGQAAQLTAMAGDSKQHEVRQKIHNELNEKFTGLEHDLSQLRVERDITIAEVEELSKSGTATSPAEAPSGTTLGRSLTVRLDQIKNQYKKELVPLTQERESLLREITELKAYREVMLEETTSLGARNEELAQLSAQYARRAEAAAPVDQPPVKYDTMRGKSSGSFDSVRAIPLSGSSSISQSFSSSTAGSLTSDETYDTKRTRVDVENTPSGRGKFMKWAAVKPAAALPTGVAAPAKQQQPQPPKTLTEHVFQQLSILRFTRCDHCSEKLWGSQLRCASCHISVHPRCLPHVHVSCSHQTTAGREDAGNTPLPPSMFGRDLTEQVAFEARGDERAVPMIVEKCIEAVETLALDYEGIYRKTGGSGQSKQITQLFERGDYASFDLRDSDRFNDICSVTSVLKTYFRTLPVPLLTHDLHEDFMRAAQIKDVALKGEQLTEAVNTLPDEHYYTLRMLMLHLNNVMKQSEKNLMNARNLGVVFGPTLMRSRDPAAEFSDMAGKALSIEWLVENATAVFEGPAL